MSVKIIYEGDTGVLLECSGDVTGIELIETNDVLIPKFNIEYQIWDFSLADNIHIEIDQIHRAAIQDNSFPENSRLTHIAFVGDTDRWGHIFETYEHMSKTWVGRRTKFTASKFEKLDEARRWIGLKN